MDDASIAAVLESLQSGDDGDDGVWAENMPALAAFLAVATQWRVATVGGGMMPAQLLYLGLDYSGAIAGLGAAGIALTPEIWDGVTIIEAAARDALNGVAP